MDIKKENEFVKQHIELVQRLLYENDSIQLPNNVIHELEEKYIDNKDLALLDKIKGINEDVEVYLRSIVQSDEILPDLDIVKEKKKEDVVELNHHDVNLMLIAKANTPEELQDAINQIPNFDVNLTKNDMGSDDFIFIKNSVFDMYKESIPKEERNEKDFNMTIDDYKELDTTIKENYDTIHMDDGSLHGMNYDAKKDINLEEIKNDNMSKKEENITLKDGFRDENNSKTLLVENFEGNLKEKQKFDVKKRELDDMFKDNSEHAFTPIMNKNDNPPKKLQLNNQNQKKDAGFAETQSMHLILLIMLFVLFALLIKFLL